MINPATTETSAIPLGAVDLTLAAGLVIAAGLISVVLRLKMEKRLLIASIRTVVQLLLVGYVLRWVFDLREIILILAFVALMIIAASREAVRRSRRTYRGMMLYALVTLTTSGLITTVTVTGIIIGAEPWYQPQYLIPLMGMVLGNSLNGISLALDSLLDQLCLKQDEVDMLLALGASRWEAARDILAESIRRGMIPIINTMMVVGIVSLPGMMTGQILQGADPAEAVKYQIVVMFMIAAATTLGCMGVVLWSYWHLFTPQHQLNVRAIHRRHE